MLKLIDEIITLYVEKEQKMLDLGQKQHSLLIINIFSGQMTDPVIEKLKENIMKLARVHQSLDLIVNDSTNTFLKFTEW